MGKCKKVLFVATVVKTHINVFHLPYLKWFQEQGYETHVCAKNDFKEEECIIPYCDIHYNIPFERSPIHTKNVKAYRELKRIIDQNEYDIIHCHTPVAAMLTRLAAIKARSKGTKVIYTAHGFHFFKGASLINWLVYYPIEWICSWFTDVLITINKEDYELASYKMKASSVYLIKGVGIDTNKFLNIEVDRVKKRREIGIPADAKILLSVGELNKNKNHAVIIKALAKLENPNIHYCIVGIGELKGELEQLAEKYNVSNRVHLLGFRKDVGELCSIADIFCFPSYREGLALSLMEAMVVGLPIICSDIRGNRDLVMRNQGGYLCNPSSTDEFVKAINKLLDDHEVVVKMKQYNIQVVKNLDVKRVLEQMIKIYKKI